MGICAGPIDWGTTWACVTALATGLSVIVLSVAAFFAKRAADHAFEQVEATRDTSMITLTNEVLNAPWLREAVDILNKCLAAANNDPANARAEIERRIAFRAATGQIDPGLDEIETKALPSYVYLARLYKRKVLDNELLIDSACGTIVIGFFVLQPQLQLAINIGVYDESILDFGRICYKAYVRPETLATHAFLDGWTI
jgi:hypothetical protein